MAPKIHKQECKHASSSTRLKDNIQKILRFFFSPRKKFLSVLIAVLIALGFILIGTSVYFSTLIDVNGESVLSVTGVEAVGKDVTISGNLISINWGNFSLGDSKEISLNLTSISNSSILLEFNVGDWSPEQIQRYIDVTWSYNGTIIEPNQTISVRISLSTQLNDEFLKYIIDNNMQSFAFKIFLTATSS
jgi:hypothetical protein